MIRIESALGVTAAALAACISALNLSSCESPSGGPIACNFHGSLPGGAACTDAVQCASGSCGGTAVGGPDGLTSPFTCGTCAPAAAVGDVCGAAGCTADAICMTLDTTAKQATYTCTTLTEGALGASCDGLTALCEPGLYCDAPTKACAQLEEAGAACVAQAGQGSYPDGCLAPLMCNTTCQIGAAGASCSGDSYCALGLGCVPGPPSTSSACTSSITWASAGQPCGQSLARCLVGSCNVGSSPYGPPPLDAGTTGTCPTVIPDGQPCTVNDSSTTCDRFSECFQGTCALLDSVACK